ncbi:MAG: hypothetical protein CME85_10370 [Henriciella sp.]|jgi:hypothetical protein|uniref:DUF4345 family protein n=1 Tax=Henriciella sp. TaxID=1968823 RepID=UPI000C112EA4|nr:DUF4345 family protein [Henriciella sp.]MAN72830.1 hypothetical protein [Henriciella sp.]MBF35324.1 hypothetical protein [Hyphomonadaceae bacterium]MBK75884.1 hypothetical protein [Henriciella sp.]PHR74950.1 MAG: hypothetical protein COA64_13170 [Henriciella sp.]|tara:strand:+ start:4957 stop:5340 length:384 start_codon:yes stop_codon:yes gene_type:complete
MLTRLFLGLIALMFLAFGLWSIIDPIGMTSRLDVTVSGPNAAFEMRGIFGGVSLAASILTGVGALSPARFERPALWFLMVYMGGYTLARLVSLIVGDNPTFNGWAFASFEILSFVLAALALNVRKQS